MKRVTSCFLIIAMMMLTLPATAGDGGKKKKKKKKKGEVTATVPAKKKDAPQFKPISEVVKDCVKKDGLFTIYQDTTTGKTYIEITEDQIGTEFIYFKHVLDAVSESRNFRGAYRDTRIFKIERYYDKIELREQNSSYYFDPENEVSKAADANINEPVVFSTKIAGLDKGIKDSTKTKILIESDALFLGETINQVKPSSIPGMSPSKSFNVGKLNRGKTKYLDISNYPENTEVVVEYGFDNPYPIVGGSEAVTNPRYTSMTIQHSFLSLPDNDYQPRYEDSRVGYFVNYTTDLTSESVTPYKDKIKRWHLVKKDPDAEISEPVEPIVWWIENTTPKEYRDIILEAGMKWNEAFEQAGFKSAIVLKIQPDDAEWDAGDIRYNVIRWTSTPSPRFGGYGPSFINPRTGQILGADIMMEQVGVTNRMRFQSRFEQAGLMSEFEVELHDMQEGEEHICQAGLYAQMENTFAFYAMEAMGVSETAREEFLHQTISRVTLHELGHTLGLAHNFCSSGMANIDELNSKEYGAEVGIAASVMDYHATNLALDPEDQGFYYIDQPGVYDEWAIEYGYRQFNSEEEEQEGLQKILARSVEPDLCFGNDADDMRSPGRGIDPSINVSDLSDDPIGFSIVRMDLIRKTTPGLKEKLTVEGESYAEYRSAYLSMTGTYGGALNVVTRFIGGVHTDRARVGQQTDNDPLTPVALEEQKRAMNTLNSYAFAPDAFNFAKDDLTHLKVQRRGWKNGGTGEDPKMHSRVLNIHRNILSAVMHPTVLTRMTDSELYGNEYSVAEMMNDLTSAIFDADLNSSVNTYRQNLQLEYIGRLESALTSKSYDNISRSAVLYQLNDIDTKLNGAKSPDASTRAHRAHILFKIENILDLD